MKNVVLAAMLSLSLIGTGCLDTDPMEPEIIVDPPVQILVSRDSITTGAHLGLTIGGGMEDMYASLQKLQEKGIFYVHVVGNIFSDVAQLNNRVQLYQSIFLDQKIGTDSGVQITFESGKVKSIYLNSGKQLSQWPLKENASSSVRVGDHAEGLYSKLLKISGNKSYSNKFERISLFTKELATQYDPAMNSSPQWYFRYQVEPGLYEDVKINFENGKVKYFDVSRYKDSGH